MSTNVPFSQCKIWNKQAEFYQNHGISAWKQIPYYATSNPYIGAAYAQVIIRYMQDISNLGQYDQNEPFYIIELGAGTGAFSFYLLKALIDLQSSLNLSHIKFSYVMTDFADKNIEFWQTQPNLLPYFEQGYLDTAFYDFENQKTIKLNRSGKLLRKATIKNPLIVIANYVYDSCPHDFFRINNAKLQIGLANPDLQVPSNINNKPIFLADIDPSFIYSDIETSCYENQKINAVLQHYLDFNEDINFIFPIAAINSIDELRKMSDDRMLLLTTDKGHSKCNLTYSKLYKPELVGHAGAFSVPVNFYAIGQYTRNFKSDFYFEDTFQDITSMLCAFGNDFNELLETQQAAKNYLNRFSPGTLLRFVHKIKQSQTAYTLQEMLAYLQCTYWDNHVFFTFLPMINEIIDTKKAINCLSVQDLLDKLINIANNFYYLPIANDTLFSIGNLLQKFEHYELALSYYKKSIHYFGRLPNTLFNMAMCYHFLSRKEESISLLEEAARLDSENLLAIGWLNFLKPESTISKE